MNRDKLTTYGIGALVILAIGVFIWTGRSGGTASLVSGDNVPCVNPNKPLIQHTHSNLEIFVDGQQEIVPANEGLSEICHRALHTHDETGEIHVEAQDRRAYTLGDFLWILNKEVQREGYDLAMEVNGAPSTELGSLVLQDGQRITLFYTTTQNN